MEIGSVVISVKLVVLTAVGPPGLGTEKFNKCNNIILTNECTNVLCIKYFIFISLSDVTMPPRDLLKTIIEGVDDSIFE